MPKPCFLISSRASATLSNSPGRAYNVRVRLSHRNPLRRNLYTASLRWRGGGIFVRHSNGLFFNNTTF